MRKGHSCLIMIKGLTGKRKGRDLLDLRERRATPALEAWGIYYLPVRAGKGIPKGAFRFN